MIRPKTLQQRLALFLLFPVALLLFSMGIVGFIYARNSLIAQWKEAAILKLQRAAHNVDMRLSRPKGWVEIYGEIAEKEKGGEIPEWILDRIENLNGVARVKVRAGDERSETMRQHSRDLPTQDPGEQEIHTGSRKVSFRGAGIQKITPPLYDGLVNHETVSLISKLIDANGQTIGRLEVSIRFKYLLEDVLSTGWWQSQKVFLVDDNGRILICNQLDRKKLGDNNDPLELATLEALSRTPSGTVLSQGHPATHVSGFYRLQQAPWTLVLVAPGREILAPIIRFRFYYFLTGILFISFTLLLIRLMTGPTVSSIKEVSAAAESIAHGDYKVSLPVKGEDEVGQLVRNFNTMVSQLQERMKLKEAMNLAMEVQQSLLPGKAPQVEGVDIAGKSIYCDETGGDYYDFLELSQWGNGRTGIAVGDVSGHGISAALLMTTVRALLRSRTRQPGSLSQIVTDVNHLLCADTAETGSFMTLFLMMIDSVRDELRWVRAGHEPAMVYHPTSDSFAELYGSGIALGVDQTWSFQEQSHEGWDGQQIILIGTDGIWETENPQFELFGKERLRSVIRQHRHRSSKEILQAITAAVSTFRQAAPQKDDITMVVVKKL
jgi:sigma-B regulation protein RsbU (phosphoserine phosphatase)